MGNIGHKKQLEQLIETYRLELCKSLNQQGFAQDALFNKAFIRTLAGRMDQGMVSWNYHQFVQSRIDDMRQDIQSINRNGEIDCPRCNGMCILEALCEDGEIGTLKCTLCNGEGKVS